MRSSEIRKYFLEFFQKRGHRIVPSSSLIPSDPSVLLTTAGMQQFKKYYVEPELAPALNVTSIQKCFRTSDIDEVGDESHLTFFEMLGNFSFGGYEKKEAIAYAHEFITKELGLSIAYTTIFKGSNIIPKDEESRAMWQKLGVSDVREEGMDDVFWGPTGNFGPCGPTTEIYCRNAAGKDVEIWNIVFNQFFFSGSREELLSGASEKRIEPLKMFGVDTGMGLERLAMVSQGKKNIFETDLFAPYFALLPNEFDIRAKRMIMDHLRGSVFLIADEVRPSNKGAGYVLRRLLRKAFVYEQKNEIFKHIYYSIIHDIAHNYGEFYPGLLKNSKIVRFEFDSEKTKFDKTIAIAYEEFKKRLNRNGTITTRDIFDLHQSYGLTKEQSLETAQDITNLIEDRVKNNVAKHIAFDEEEFEKFVAKHREISRVGQVQKFGGHGLILDTGELKAGNEEELKKVTKLHTATHLLQAALRKILGESVQQAGSDITADRLRFDFTFGRKLTDEEVKKIEELVNFAISQQYEVQAKEMSYVDAMKLGALHFFKEKYPLTVKVYTVGDFQMNPPYIFSRELCGGPHVRNTAEVGRFKIQKQEAIGSGLRRVRAIVD